ncbi:hypothetical protein [Legionella hackeliae]|uniref:Uncharacterized protein n=1 Tax=Legionella hackeliae TaxID=449 RepID=A0A0A8UWN7_LEGHA|nr:hypothetical protein [Legionella hackeliae]KTD15480.1 hypothetical protein Lhac_0322 [Legionella hackeliae]CEK11149.1 protein of unknown function [Legionella hackeliae]STX47907.1 Uncharacterised protein [Legionella hackeliae]
MAFYISPGLMYRRFKSVSRAFSRDNDKIHLEQLDDIFEVYTLCTKQYLGLGSLLRFIPGTNAYKVSQQLYEKLEQHSKILSQIIDESASKSSPLFLNISFTQNVQKAYLRNYFSPSFIYYEFLANVTNEFKNPGISYSKNLKIDFKSIFLRFPIIKGLLERNAQGEISLQKTAGRFIIYTLLNPVSVVLGAWQFLHLLVNRLLEVGAARGPNPFSFIGITRFLLKGLVGLVFGTIGIAISLVKSLIDIPVHILSPVIDSMNHFRETAVYAFEHRGQETLVANVSELQQVKLLRKQAKNRDSSYAAITKETDYKTEYVGISKFSLYSDQANPEQLVAIRGSKEKIAKTASLLKLVSLFADRDSEKFSDETVREAQKLLNITI